MILQTQGYGTLGKEWHVQECCSAGFCRVYFLKGGSITYSDMQQTRLLDIGKLYVFPSHSPYSISHTPENPLYVVAIGAITNVASAFLINPKMAENTVVVWLGGHSREFDHTREFNMYQDVAASRVVMGSGVPFVQLPCKGVVSAFTLSKPEIEHWLLGKNPLADYLGRNSIEAAEQYAHGKAWTRCIWDVTAVAWLLNDNDRFMNSRLVPTYLSSYDNHYCVCDNAPLMRYIYNINRDELMTALLKKIAE